jgi:hypothetical protein
MSLLYDFNSSGVRWQYMAVPLNPVKSNSFVNVTGAGQVFSLNEYFFSQTQSVLEQRLLLQDCYPLAPLAQVSFMA